MIPPRQKVKDLIELALDGGGADKERVSAAMKALRIIRKYDLLAGPLDAATDVFSRITDPGLVDSVKKIVNQIRRR